MVPKRASSALKAISPSIRASAAPMQWWMPHPKLKGRVVPAAEVERVGRREACRVVVGRALQNDDAVAALQGLTEEVGGLQCCAHIELDRAVEAQQLLDRRRGDVGMGPPVGQLVGMAQQG